MTTHLKHAISGNTLAFEAGRMAEADVGEQDLLSKVINAIAHGLSSLATYATPVSKEAQPALRALIRHTFPDLNRNPHLRAKIEAFAAQSGGHILNSAISRAKTMEGYSNVTNQLLSNDMYKNFLKEVRKYAEKTTPEAQHGYGQVSELPVAEGQFQEERTSGRVTGKQTLSARFVQPGDNAFDTTIPKKVESMVSGDIFNYYAPNPENGALNGLFLNDMQWEKDIHNRRPLDLPRSGDDQLYFPSWQLDPRYQNQQPVLLELEEAFQDNLYASYMAQNQSVDFLRDQQIKRDPIMDTVSQSYMQPEITLQGDGVRFYPDPEQPRSSAFVNHVGFRPIYDSYRNPTQPSRFNPPTLIMSPQDALRLVEVNGFQAYSLT